MNGLALLALVVASPLVPVEAEPPRHCDAEALDCAEACADQCVGDGCLVPCARSCQRELGRCRRTVRRHRNRRNRERRRRISKAPLCFTGLVSIAHEDDVKWVSTERGTVFENRQRKLAAAAGGSQLGCTLTEVPPGKTAWPFHAHLGNEEAIYVLEGHATLRLGDRQHALKPGDYVALAARADAAHQVINTSDAPVRYLAISTMNPTDVIVYPDSKKHGILAGEGASDHLMAFLPIDASVGLWHDEPTGEAEAAAEAAAAEQEAEAEIEEQVDEQLEAMKKRLKLED